MSPWKALGAWSGSSLTGWTANGGTWSVDDGLKCVAGAAHSYLRCPAVTSGSLTVAMKMQIKITSNGDTYDLGGAFLLAGASSGSNAAGYRIGREAASTSTFYQHLETGELVLKGEWPFAGALAGNHYDEWLNFGIVSLRNNQNFDLYVGVPGGATQITQYRGTTVAGSASKSYMHLHAYDATVRYRDIVLWEIPGGGDPGLEVPWGSF